MDRNTAHAVMTTSMLIIGATVILSQGWWTGLRNFIEDKTGSGSTAKGLPTGTRPLDWRWVWGYVFLWLVLSVMIESRNFAELGASIAAIIAMSVTFAYGPKALQNVGVVNAQGK